MATPAVAGRQPIEVIDLVSSDTEDELEEVPAPAVRPRHRLQHRPDAEPEPIPELPENSPFIPPLAPDFFEDLEHLHGFNLDASPGASPRAVLDETPPGTGPHPGEHGPGQYVDIDGEPVFIPDSPEPRAQPLQQNQANQEPVFNLDARVVTADDCVTRVLEMFPDVKHDYVRELYRSLGTPGDYEGVTGEARYENIIDKLVTGDYPKQDKAKRVQKKRKREEDDPGSTDTKRWEGPDRMPLPTHLKGSMVAMIKAEFPTIPNAQIQKLLGTHKHFYQTYIEVANMRDMCNPAKVWRGRPTSNGATADTIGANSGSGVLLEELTAAREKVTAIRAARTAAEALKRAEKENLQRAMEAGETAECQACFEDLPMNRQIHCNGDAAHFTCFECAATYIKSEVGESRCRVLCTAGCGAGFAHAQLHLLSDKPLIERLEHLQQEKDIRDAGLDNLEECPFCEYKAILPPVEEDFEFRCANPECEKVSCRRCKALSHIPRSCEEYAKENKLNTRHKIEEAMTAALVRSCNKCKKQFIKDYGCNKMTCPSCSNMQCYVCSESLKDYNHFDQQPTGPHRAGQGQATGAKKKCPLYDNVEERHDREVKEAEAAARAAAKAENPDVTDDDLQIKVSDAVTKATQDRMNRARPGGGIPGIGFPALPHHMHAHRLFGAEAADFDEDGDDEADFFGNDVGGPHRDAARARRVRDAEMRLAIRQRLRDAARRDRRPPPQPMLAPPRPFGGYGQLGPLQGMIPVYAPQAAANDNVEFFGVNNLLGQNVPPHPQAAGGRDDFGQHAPGHGQAVGAPGGMGPGRPLGQPNNGRDAFLGAFDEDAFGGGPNLDPFWPGFFPINGNDAPAANNRNARQRAQGQRHMENQQIRQALEQQRLALQRMHERLGGQGQVGELPRGDARRRHEPRGWPGQPRG